MDKEKKGFIDIKMIRNIMDMLGQRITEESLAELITEFDIDGTGQLQFETFCELAARFLVEEDEEAMQAELKEAFRLYDKEGNGYITTDVLKSIFKELDDKISDDDLDDMIDEIDADGSGTVDYDGKNPNNFFTLMCHTHCWLRKSCVI